MSSLTNRASRILVLLVLSTFAALTACRGSAPAESDAAAAFSGPAAAAVTLDEFPEGIGQGYPLIVVDEAAGDVVRAGDPAPDFRLQLDDGRTASLADMRGQPVMLNFWATWCGPCRAEMPDIVAAYEREEELVVIAVNVQEDVAVITPFAEEFAMSMPVGRDHDGDLRQLYSLRGMPTSVFIDREGNISTIWSGLLTEDRLEELLAEIL